MCKNARGEMKPYDVHLVYPLACGMVGLLFDSGMEIDLVVEHIRNVFKITGEQAVHTVVFCKEARDNTENTEE